MALDADFRLREIKRQLQGSGASDASLLSRANHTGTQPASTISDFAEAVDDRIAALLVEGSNVTLTYNDTTNQLEIAATSGGGPAEGTSFPGSPSPNDRFYRTDLNLLCYYDGTRWLTVQEYELALQAQQTLLNFTATTAIGYGPVRKDFDLYLVRWVTTSFVNGTNNGTNFWTITLQRVDVDNALVNLSSYSTAADVAANNVNHDQGIDAALDVGTISLRVLATETGNAGGLFSYNLVTYRLIVT